MTARVSPFVEGLCGGSASFSVCFFEVTQEAKSGEIMWVFMIL